MTEDEVVSIFRGAGGKLRPDDAGLIVEIDLSFSNITDSELLEIKVFPHVAELDLTGTPIHDEGVLAVHSLTDLRAVKLKGTKITDYGLCSVSRISTLILLDASNTEISDEGLRDASQLSNLRYLSLNNTAVSDAGLRYLETLRGLKGLSVINTAVTDEGIRSLKEKLPECLIVAQAGREISHSGIDNRTMPPLSEPWTLDSASTGVASFDQLSQVVQLAGRQPHLAVHLSTIYSSRDQWKEAAQILAVAAAANPGDRATHFALGQALARSGRPEEALQQFEQAVDEATARYQVALIVYENSLKRCERLFDEALSADPSLSGAENRRLEIRQELAKLGVRQSDWQTAQIEGDPVEVVPAPPVRSVSHTRLKRAR